MKAYIREIVWVGIAQATVFIGGLATVKTATVILGPAEYGKLSIALAIVGIAQVCLYGSISQAATRFLSFALSANLFREYQISLGKLALLAVAAVGVFGGAASVLELSDWLPLPAVVLCIYAITNGTQVMLIAVSNAARQRKLVAAAQMVDAVIRPLLIVAIAHFAFRTTTGIFSAYVFSSVSVIALIIVMWMRIDWRNPGQAVNASHGVSFPQSQNLTWGMMSFAAPFIIFGVLGALGSHGERLLLSKWVGWEDVGSYALMAQLAMAPNVLFTSVINQFYLPVVFQLDPSGTREIGRSFRLYLLASIAGIVVVTAAVSVSGSWLIPIFSTRAFLGHEHLLWWLGLSAGMFCIAQQLVLPGLRLNRPAIYMPAKFLHSLTLLWSSLIFVPELGVNGMGIASLSSSAVYLVAIVAANAWLQRAPVQLAKAAHE